MIMRKAVFFTLVLYSIDSTFSVTHSLHYVYTGTSGISSFPEFTVVGMVDEEPFLYYDSITHEAVPRQDWIAKSEGPDYWKRQNDEARGEELMFKANIETFKRHFNQNTKGVHTLQLMYGCELHDNGTTQGYLQYGYNGADFLSLDKKTLTWTAANEKAFITKNKWDPSGYAQQRNGYLENECIEWLKKYVGYGKDTIERKVHPNVFLLQSGDSSPVTCQATGFYPSGVVMSWQRDGVDLHEDVETGLPVPNGDGTFQMRSRLRVTPEDLQKHTYTCAVQHSSSELSVVKTVNQEDILRNKITGPGNILPIPIIIIIIAGAVLLQVAVGFGGFLLWRSKNNKPGFIPAELSLPNGFNSFSNNQKC